MKVIFADFHKFCASLGITLISLSFLTSWPFLREAIPILSIVMALVGASLVWVGLRHWSRNQTLSDEKLALEVQLKRRSLQNSVTEFTLICVEAEREVVQCFRSIRRANTAVQQGKMADGIKKNIVLTGRKLLGNDMMVQVKYVRVSGRRPDLSSAIQGEELGQRGKDEGAVSSREDLGSESEELLSYVFMI